MVVSKFRLTWEHWLAVLPSYLVGDNLNTSNLLTYVERLDQECRMHTKSKVTFCQSNTRFYSRLIFPHFNRKSTIFVPILLNSMGGPLLMFNSICVGISSFLSGSGIFNSLIWGKADGASPSVKLQLFFSIESLWVCILWWALAPAAFIHSWDSDDRVECM